MSRHTTATDTSTVPPGYWRCPHCGNIVDNDNPYCSCPAEQEQASADREADATVKRERLAEEQRNRAARLERAKRNAKTV